MDEERVYRVEVGPVDDRGFYPEGAEHVVRVWRGWTGNTSANAETFTTEQLRDYVRDLNDYLEGL